MRLFYYDETGLITQSQRGAMSPAELENLRSRGLRFAIVPEDAHMDRNYFLDDVLTVRPVADIAIDRTEIAVDDTDAATITGLPDPCRVTIDGVAHDVVGGTLEITSTMPATYSIRFDQWPWTPWSTVITAA